eukprot:11266241-Alexandrium_andersonii.AAC.1
MTPQLLRELVELRSKMGFELSFLEDDCVLDTVRLANKKSCIITRMRTSARQADQREQGPQSTHPRPSWPAAAPAGAA